VADPIVERGSVDSALEFTAREARRYLEELGDDYVCVLVARR
jgi:hypothetical protein